MEESKKVISRQDKILGWFLCILGPMMAVTSLAMKFNEDAPVSTLICVLLVAISSLMFVTGLLCLSRPSLFVMILGGLSIIAWIFTAAPATGRLDDLVSDLTGIATPASLLRLLFAAIIGVIIGKLIYRSRNRNDSPADATTETTDPAPADDA